MEHCSVYSSRAIKNMRLTKAEYNYLLPAINRSKLSNSQGYYFLGTEDEIKDVKNRLQGLDW